MAEGRALHAPSNLWHYVRGYGPTLADAETNIAAECQRKGWTLDPTSVRLSESRKEGA